MRIKNTYYLVVMADEISLPVYCAETLKEAALWLQIPYQTAKNALVTQQTIQTKYKIERVVLDDPIEWQEGLPF